MYASTGRDAGWRIPSLAIWFGGREVVRAIDRATQIQRTGSRRDRATRKFRLATPLDEVGLLAGRSGVGFAVEGSGPFLRWAANSSSVGIREA